MKKSNFINGTFIATASIVLVKILGMLYVIPFYSIVGQSGAALYSYAYTVFNISLDIAILGLPIAVSKITNEFDTKKMYDAKERAYKIAMKIIFSFSIVMFLIVFFFAKPIATVIIGNLTGGNTIEDVTKVIRVISIALLVVPTLNVTQNYLHGHNIIGVSSISSIIEQVVRILILLSGSYITINIINKSTSDGVSVALTSVFISAICAYLFIVYKIKKHKKSLNISNKKDNITNKEITKKLFQYAIPFIIVNIISSIYGFINMIIIMRSMSYIGYDAQNVEFITSSITTWSAKINMIIVSLATGMTTSLVPTIVNSFTKKNWDELNNNISTALKIIVFISLPMAIGLSILSQHVWTIFYSSSEIGSNILSVSVFVAVFLNLFMVVSTIAQGLNAYKTAYKTSLLSYIIIIPLAISFILLFNKTKILPPYIGGLIATIIGYFTATIIVLKDFKKMNKSIKYASTIKTTSKIIFINIVMAIILLIIKNIYYVNTSNKIICVIYILINAFIGVIIYFILAKKFNLIEEVFGKDKFKKISFKKIKK